MSVTKVPIDMSKYFATEGEKEKLQYPKPPKSKKLEYISEPEMKEELQYPTKKMATETFKFKPEEVMDTGEKEKLIFEKEPKFPEEGDVKPTTDTKTPQKYISKGETEKLQKSKPFTVDEAQPAAKVEVEKYYLEFEKAKPFQKQFSLEKFAGRTLEEWMKYLKEKRVPRKIRRQFKHIWESALERGESEEYAARAAIDILPERVLEKPTPYHGKEKTGPIKKRSSMLLTDIIGYTFASFLKWAAECPEEFHKLISEIETVHFYPKSILKEATLQKMSGRTLEEWMKYLKEKRVPRKVRRQFKHIWESALERGESEEYAARAAIDILPKRVLEKPTPYHGKEKTGPIKKADLDEEISRKQEELSKLQEEVAKLQRELADLAAKKAEELAKAAK